MDKKEKNEIRRKIENELESIPSGTRVEIDKDLLEQLLFEDVIYDGTLYRVPAWSGQFLRKIDLSQVNFENVTWSYFKECSTVYRENHKSSFKEQKKYEEMAGEDYFASTPRWFIDYSETNANIDLYKSGEYKDTGKI